MPLYEYRCTVCGCKEENLESFSAPTQHDCAQCGAKLGMNRQISVSAFSLHGDGWYAQGYGKDKEIACAAAKEATSTAAATCCNGCPHSGGH